MISPRSIKKELAKGQSLPEPKTVTTRAKAGSKWKKPSEPEEDNFQVERQIHEFVTERFDRLKAHQDKSLAKAEENLAGLRSIIMVAEIHANKAEMEATDEAKVCVAHAILHARIKIAQVGMDPGFDRSAWDVAGWKQILLELGGDAESKQVQALEAGPSGVKDVNVTLHIFVLSLFRKYYCNSIFGNL
ncbi:hypothetical protein Hanom_Chr07g00617061 [Helianthus anomalus]